MAFGWYWLDPHHTPEVSFTDEVSEAQGDCSGLHSKEVVQPGIKSGLLDPSPGALKQVVSKWWYDEVSQLTPCRHRIQLFEALKAKSQIVSLRCSLPATRQSQEMQNTSFVQ